MGTGPQETLFTTFCFPVASTFAKMGLLTFGGGSMGCVWPSWRVELACGQPQPAGRGAPPGRRPGRRSWRQSSQAAGPAEENRLSGKVPPLTAAPTTTNPGPAWHAAAQDPLNPGSREGCPHVSGTRSS